MRARLTVVTRGKSGRAGTDCDCALHLPTRGIGMSRISGGTRGIGTIVDCAACNTRWTFVGGVDGRIYSHPGRGAWLSGTVGGRWSGKPLPAVAGPAVRKSL